MATVPIRDILDNETGEPIFPRTHVKAVIGLADSNFFEEYVDGNGARSVKLRSDYVGLWADGWIAAGGIGTGGGGGTDLNRVWESLTNNTDFPNEKINLAHIPDVPYTQVTGLDSWIAGKGYLLPSSLKTVNGNSLVGSGNITIADGRDGKSAYQIWLDEGNVGTEADFLASLKGDTGVSADYPITIYNGLDSSATDQALAALQGKLLAARIAAVSDAIQAPEVDTLPYDAFRINLFNPADPDIESGYLIDQNGNLQQNANYFVTGYISFTPSMGKLILSVNGNDVTGYGGGIALYDSNKALIDVIIEGNVGGIVEWKNKVAFARFSVPGSVSSKVQVEVGGTITPYLAYGVQFARDSFVVPGSLIPDATVTGAKLAPGSVSTDKCDFFKVNLYNPDDADVVFGYFLDGNGTLQFNSNWLTTGYIPFTSGKMCASANGHSADGGGYIVLYDASKTKVASVMSGSTGNVATWQSGVAYARFSIYAGADDDVQVELGDTITDYIEPGTAALDPDIEVHSEIPDGAVTESKIANGAVTTEKCDFFKANLFDPSDQDVEIGYFLDNNGALQSNAYYLVTGYIPFTSGKMCASVNGTPGAGGGHLVLYDASKTKIAAYMGSSVNNVATWQSGVAYVRFSLMGYSAGSIQVETGDTITSYIPYGDPILDPKYSGAGPQVVSILGQDGERKTATSLSANANLTLDSFPYHIKKGLCMSLYADLSSFGNVYVGKGYNQYRGEWVKVTASNVVLQRYESGTIDVETVAHGLSISTFVKVALSWDNNGDLHVVVNSIGGDFQYTFNQSCFEANYAPFVRCESSVSNVVLSATCTDFRFPVWACGDSYFGVNIARWPGWMKEYGYFNFLLNGLAGQNSQGAFADLKRMMKFGCPKYLLWMLGMNDSDAAFENYFGQVKTLCEQNGITLIAATIPTVPERNKETISGLVRSSGLRYIDCYKAVGANSSGVWYTGYLDDGVHPTTLGAKALATQVLVDFPELMQYGLSS